MRVLEAVRRRKAAVRCFVYASSFEVYAELEPNARALTETSRTKPKTDYGATKLSGEDHAFAFSAEEGTRIAILRLPANTTARPDVSMARTTACSGSRPVWRPSR